MTNILQSIQNKLATLTPNVEAKLATEFEEIIGYDDVKDMTSRACTSEGRVKIDFNGPPASGKSLLIDAIANAYGDKCFHFEASTGSVEKFLQELELVQDKVSMLTIDELDKWSAKAQTLLYTLFEKGQTDLEFKSYEVHIKLADNFKIFCSSNSTKKLNEPLKSRMDIFNFVTYTKEEFIAICTIKLANAGIPENLIVPIIAYKLEKNDKDVRRVIGLIEYIKPKTDTPESILKLLRTKDKYNAPDNDYN